MDLDTETRTALGYASRDDWAAAVACKAVLSRREARRRERHREIDARLRMQRKALTARRLGWVPCGEPMARGRCHERRGHLGGCRNAGLDCVEGRP